MTYRHKKYFSQVFLKESWPCEQLADLVQSHGVLRTVEIGPGQGVLTQELLKRGMGVSAIERDADMVPYLKKSCGSFENFQLTVSDVLKLDWQEVTQGHQALVGNIPYHISTAITMRTLEVLPRLGFAAYLVQDEFAKRLAAPAGSKDYSRLSVYAQLRSVVNYEFKVAKTCFEPAIKVDSAVVSFLPREVVPPEKVLNQVEWLCEALFRWRRKKIRHALKSALSEEQFLMISERFDLDRRAQNIGLEEWLEMATLTLP